MNIKKTTTKIIPLLGLFLFLSSKNHAQVVINEFSSSNLKSFIDDHSDYEDWIELYNTSGSAINIGGFHLSDDTTNLTKYVIPAGTTIGANGFVRFWCSGRNTFSGTHYHTNFKLTQTKNKSERIAFSDPTGNLIEKVEAKKTKVGHSRGRKTDGATTWAVFTSPTPNTTNNGAFAYAAYSQKPSMSITAGFYPSSVSVTLTNNEPTSTKIRYTTNGNEPTTSSTLYTGPITISSTKVLKAVAFSDSSNILSSFIEYNTYFINEHHTIPVVSISGTSLTSLANGNQMLRPYGAIEYFDTLGVRKAKSYGEFNSHGQDSWANSQRSLDFVARDEMGYSKGIKEKLFPLTNRDEFQRVILRAAGDDNYPADHHQANDGSAHLRDAFFQNLCKENGLNLDVRTGVKCVVYLNGNYWGVYDIREIPDDHDYTEYYYGQGKYDLQYVLTWGNTWAEYGGQQAINDFYSIRNYIMNNNMANAASFAHVDSLFDYKSLADYVIVHALSNSSDWLNYNTGVWRGLNPNGGHKKWGYILWDNDASFAFYINYTGIPDTSASADLCNVESPVLDDPEQHVDMLLKLMQNPDVKQYYVMRYNDLMNTAFECNYILAYLDSTKNVIDPEMARHATRWNGTYTEWIKNYNRLRGFIQRRCGTNPDMNMTGCYNLNGPYNVTFTCDTVTAGRLTINSLTRTAFPWNAKYYGGMKVKLYAQSVDTTLYLFNHWTAPANTLLAAATNDTNAINFKANDVVTAYFNKNPLASIQDKPSVMQYGLVAQPSVFSDNTIIQFTMPENNAVKILLTNVAGQKIADLQPIGNNLQAGTYSFELNANTYNLSTGMYFIHLMAGENKKTIKIIVQN